MSTPEAAKGDLIFVISPHDRIDWIHRCELLTPQVMKFKPPGAESLMKNFVRISGLFVVPMFVLLGTTNAYCWTNLISCDGGKFIIEKECYTGPSEYGSPPCYSSKTQMVIRNPKVQNYFASHRSFGWYQHPGKFFGFASAQTPEMLIAIDNQKNWGMSGYYNYSLYIPYADDHVNISYYINYTGPNSITIKAVANRTSVYGIVREGELASWNYYDCAISSR